jgi:hypothetical protein
MYRRWYFWVIVIAIIAALVLTFWPAPIREAEPGLPGAGPIERTPQSLPLAPDDEDESTVREDSDVP